MLLITVVLQMLQTVMEQGSDVADVGGKTSLRAAREQSQLVIAARHLGLDAFTNTRSRLPLARVETEVERPRPIPGNSSLLCSYINRT